MYCEFQETGITEKLGYTNPADLVEDYPAFFWNVAKPYLKDALRYLQLTQEGKQWIANLHSHVFAMEHGQFHLGPFSEKNNQRTGLVKTRARNLIVSKDAARNPRQITRLPRGDWVIRSYRG